MAKKTNNGSELPDDLASAQREYADLAEQCGSFDRQTRKMLEDNEARRKAIVMERATLRTRLLARKGLVHARMVELTTTPEPVTAEDGEAGGDGATAMFSLTL